MKKTSILLSAYHREKESLHPNMRFRTDAESGYQVAKWRNSAENGAPSDLRNRDKGPHRFV